MCTVFHFVFLFDLFSFGHFTSSVTGQLTIQVKFLCVPVPVLGEWVWFGLKGQCNLAWSYSGVQQTAKLVLLSLLLPPDTRRQLGHVGRQQFQQVHWTAGLQGWTDQVLSVPGEVYGWDGRAAARTSWPAASAIPSVLLDRVFNA